MILSNFEKKVEFFFIKKNPQPAGIPRTPLKFVPADPRISSQIQIGLFSVFYNSKHIPKQFLSVFYRTCHS